MSRARSDFPFPSEGFVVSDGNLVTSVGITRLPLALGNARFRAAYRPPGNLSAYALGRGSQAFRHALRRLAFADKGIGPGGERGLVTGIHMADKDNDQRGRAGLSEFFKSRTRRAGE